MAIFLLIPITFLDRGLIDLFIVTYYEWWLVEIEFYYKEKQLPQ